MEGLIEKLTKYGQGEDYPYHMPGHKRRLCGDIPAELFQMDITEIDGFDNLHDPEGVLLDLQKRIAALYGADESFCLVGGSTAGILSAISAAVPFGGRILMARNCHKSAYHAAYLRRLQVSYLWPRELAGEFRELFPLAECSEAARPGHIPMAGYNMRDVAEDNPVFGCSERSGTERFPISDGITPAQVEEVLKAQTDIQAVLIVSPTYEGRISPIREIARVVHSYGKILIVDGAHGAHLVLAGDGNVRRDLTERNSDEEPDLVIHSVHKTLPAPTQTALLHVCGDRVDRDLLRRFLRIYQSSSPSYLLMAGVDNCIQLMEKEGKALYDAFFAQFQKLVLELRNCRSIKIIATGCRPGETFSAAKQDAGKLLLFPDPDRMTGRQLYDRLREKYHLQLEMAAQSFCLAMFTIGDTEEGFRRFRDAVREIDEELQGNVVPEKAAGMQGNVVPKKAAGMQGDVVPEKAAGMQGNAVPEKAAELQGNAVPKDATVLRNNAEPKDIVEALPKAPTEDTAGQHTRMMAGSETEQMMGYNPECALPIVQAWDLPCEEVPLQDCAGHISADFINLYPPGTPILVPGERFTKEICQYLQRCHNEGLQVQGIRNQDGMTVKCVREEIHIK